MWQKKKICLSCRHFRVQDEVAGVCRVDKGGQGYPRQAHEHLCDRWSDCGQQYYIRKGWVAGRRAKEGQAGSQ